MSKQKLFATLGIFALLVMTLGIVSAASLTVKDINAPLSIYNTSTSFDVTFNLTNTGLETDINWSDSIATEGTITSFTFSKNYINASESLIITATITVPIGQTGNISGNITAGVINGSGSDETFKFTVQIIGAPLTPILGCTNVSATNYNPSATVDDGSCTYPVALPFACPDGSRSSKIIIGKVKDESDIKDDWKWVPFNSIDIKAEIENQIGGEDDDADLIVELYLVDSNNSEVSSDVVDDTDDLEDSINLDNDESDDLHFTFDIANDAEEGNYELYIKVYEDGNSAGECRIYDAHSVSIDRNSRDVIVNDVNGPTTVKAGESSVFDVNVANIGRKDEERVKILAYSKDLGILKSYEFENLDAGEEDSISMTILIPEDAVEGEYAIVFSTEFNYDEKKEYFDEESDTDNDVTHTVTVLEGVSSSPSIGARLLSDAKVGKELEVEVAIKNNGKSGSFVIFLDDYDTWTDSAKIDDDSFILNSGSTKTTLLRLMPNKMGQQKFTVIIENSDGKRTEQEVSVNIQESTGFLTGAFAGLGLGAAGSYLVGAIILIAILILVVLIIKLSRPRRIETRHDY